ncbi:exodeoxyribonuclease V subunit alpha [Methylomonas rhizoryzae]|uniref:exodeoxyribonuclease V subunit alpha n=1 Tax=Methylomonas rhizoryzae TaxID=2608981 RepID=UPI0012328E49|nr:exodeoxyribonuclease V subunit alpha [Methylomonas rhizoryzae]
MMPSVFEDMQAWRAQGWLSALDQAFAKFLSDLAPNVHPCVLWAGALVSRQLSRGEVYLDIKRLSVNPQLTLALPAEAASTSGLATISHFSCEDWLNALSGSCLVGLGEGDTPLVLSERRLYLRRFWHYQRIVERETVLRSQPVRAHLPPALATRIRELFADSQVPDWQQIACVLALRAKLAIITGGPGTGKTTTVTKLLALLTELAQIEQTRLPVIALAAPTGKAAARVSESIAGVLENLTLPAAVSAHIPQKAGTLHRLLGSRPDSRKYRHNRQNPLSVDVVIVDEASMIDLEMMAALLEALPQSALLILLGDKDQLASVEAGAVLGELCAGAEHAAYDTDTLAWINRYAGATLPARRTSGTPINLQTVMLRHSHRFGAGSGIGRLATAVNAGDADAAHAVLNHPAQYVDISYLQVAADLSGNVRNLVLAAASEREPIGYGRYLAEIARRADFASSDAWASAVLKSFERFRMLCALRQGDWGVEALNRLIRHCLFGPSDSVWYPGRPVMISRNDYNLGLMNGDIGIALPAADGRLRIAFPTDGGESMRWISPLRLPAVETAFAMTVHKSQGSEFEHVALLLPDAMSPVLSRELVYTAITRAKRHFSLLESGPGVWRPAVERRHNA